MQTKHLILATAIAGTSLTGCKQSASEPRRFTKEVIRMGTEMKETERRALSDNPTQFAMQWLNYPDSVNIKHINPTLFRSSLQPKPGAYYIASGYVMENGQIYFDSLQEITREQADDLRKMKSVPAKELHELRRISWEDALRQQAEIPVDTSRSR